MIQTSANFSLLTVDKTRMTKKRPRIAHLTGEVAPKDKIIFRYSKLSVNFMPGEVMTTVKNEVSNN